MKTFLKIFGGLIVLIILAVSIFLWTFDLNSYRGMITEKLSAALGHPVSIERLEMKLALVPTIKISNISVENPSDFSGEKPLFKSNSAEITLALAPILSHRLEIQKVSFEISMINLIEKDGKNNWIDTSTVIDTSPNKKDAWIKDLRLDNIVFAKTIFSLKTDKKNYSATLDDMSIKQLQLFSFNMITNNQNFKVSGNGNILNLLQGKSDFLFNVEVTAPSLTAKLNGNIGDTKQLKQLVLKLNVESNNLKEALKIFQIQNQKIPTLPAEISASLQGNLETLEIAKLNGSVGTNKIILESTGTIENILLTPQFSLAGKMTLSDSTLAQTVGLKPLAVQFEAQAASDKISLNPLILQANRSNIQLSSEITNFVEKPQINLNIESEFINTTDFLFQTETLSSRSKPSNATLFPNFKIDLSGLKKYDVQAHLNLPYIQIGTKTDGYFGLEGDITLQDGVLSTEQVKGDFFGGYLTTQFTINTQSNIPTYETKATFKGLNLDKIPSLNSIIQGSQLELDIDAQTSGLTSDQILTNLNGEIIAEISEGSIINDWFNNLPIVDFIARQKTSALTYSNSDKISKVLCGAARIDIKNGILSSADQIALETSNINFLWNGSFNLKTEEINLSVHPIFDYTDPKLNALSSLGQFVKITGTLSDIKPTLNTEAPLSQLSNLIDVTPRNPYALCQTILNYKTIGQQNNEKKQNTLLSFPTQEEPVQKELTPQEQFQEQLIDNLKKVLN